MLEEDVLDERAEFHDARQKVIGATDSPKILGLSRRGTALTVYREKTGAVPKREMSLPAWLGLKMERTVAELYEAATGRKVRADNIQHVHREYPWLGCHLDYREAGNGKRLIECKTRAYMSGGWGADGSEEVPPDIWVQCQHEMFVVNATVCDVAVLFGHHTYRTYVIPRNDAFTSGMVPKLSEFWHENVLAGIPPLPTGFAGDSDAIRDTYPDHTDVLRTATPAQLMLVNRLRGARESVVREELAKAELENLIKNIIGDAAGLTGPFGTITWKKSKDSVSVDWEAVAATYDNVINDLLLLVAPGDDDATVARLARAQSAYDTAVGLFTTVKPGSRRFLATFKED
jgi:putative phage-type endonuclease